jgi:protein gp37
MAQATKIEWTDVSWNPVHGCSRVSTGCLHCYAETLSLRHGQTKAPWTARNAEQNVMLKPHKLREPLSKAGPWKNPCRVFVNSMSDLFHEQIPDEYIARVFAVMAEARQHTFQILTKRPERMRDLLSSWAAIYDVPHSRSSPFAWGETWPVPNVWLGVSIENRKWVGRADVLRETPATVRFISAEPLLEGLVHDDEGGFAPPSLDLTGIDWVIVGGESGSGHRPFDPQWARDLRDACMEMCPLCASGDYCGDCAGVRRPAYFLKQLGGHRPGTALEDLPEDLRIREFPR